MPVTISLLSGGTVRRNSLRCAPFGPPTVSCVLAPARTCLRQAPPTSRGRGLATSAVPHHLTDDISMKVFALEKRCQKTSFFTPFQKIEQNGVKSGRFLHRLFDTRFRKAHLISDPIDQTQRSMAMPETEKRLTQKGWSLFYIGCRRVVGRLRQSSASLHPPSGTLFLREPLTRPRPATLCRRLPATTQLTSLPVFQQQVPYFEPACAWTLLYKQHTS